VSRWVDDFNNSTYSQNWLNLQEILKDDNLIDPENDLAVQELARLRKLCAYLSELKSSIDPELFPLSPMNMLAQHTGNTINEINSFQANKNHGHLQNAGNHLEQVLLLLGQCMPQAGGGSRAAEKSAKTMLVHMELTRQKSTQTLDTLKTESAELAESITGTERTVEALNQKLEQLDSVAQGQLAEFTTQFKNEEFQRKSEFDKETEDLETRSSELMNQLKTDVKDTLNKISDDTDEEFKRLGIKSGKVIEVLAKFQDDAGKVYDVTINTLHGGAYSSYANDERKTANLLRMLASFLMLAGVAVLIIPEAALLMSEALYVFDWKKMVGRVPLSLVVFVPAFYFARESGKHRTNEVANRRRQHILTTLDPYIELMDKEKGQELKVHVGQAVFSEAVTDDGSASDTGNLIAQLTNLTKQLKP